jgi:hypothetical protein
MKRRAFLLTGSALAIGVAAAAASPSSFAQPRYTVSAGQLQRLVGERFPLRFPVADLFDLDLQAPRLRLMPALNRIAAEMTMRAAGPALRRSYDGSFDVDFALRYEPSDQSIRAHRLRAHSFRLPGVAPEMLMLLESQAQVLAERSLLEVVLHRLQPRELALADTMGLQPGEITVSDEGLVIGFVPKPR